MKRFIKSIACCILLAGLAFVYSCGDDKKTTPDPTPVPVVKTLKKELLYDKTWYQPVSGHKHKFNSDGTYKTGGTWKWLNSSDSMEIKEAGFPNAFIWYFKYSTEHEMACALGWQDAAANAWSIYRDTP